MESVPVACMLIVTIIAIYFPIAHIRWGSKVVKALEKIEENTRKG